MLLLICVMWNRAAWGDPKWPLLGVATVIALWSLLAVYTLVGSAWIAYQGRERELAIFSFVLAIIPLAGVVLFVLKARQVPPIHDISTDTINPPEFVLAKKVRHSSHNSLEYTFNNAEVQRQAYPAVQPLLVPIISSELIVAAEAVVNKLGWHMHGMDKEKGIIEAYTTTPVLGFVDDVVIRVESVSSNESRIDIRSKSRVGVSDLGANAKRFQLFFDELWKQPTLSAEKSPK